jgi:hypothetical protein
MSRVVKRSAARAIKTSEPRDVAASALDTPSASLSRTLLRGLSGCMK